MYMFNHFPGGVHLHPSQKTESPECSEVPQWCLGAGLIGGNPTEIGGFFEREKCGKIIKKGGKIWKNMEKTMENLGINGVNSANDVENPCGKPVRKRIF